MTTETWRPVPGYEGLYDVSDQGRMRSWQPCWLTLPRVLRPGVSDGYPQVALIGKGRRVTVAVHVLVAAAFLGPRPEGQEVRHLDGDRGNPHVSNLTYGTHSENMHDAVGHGTHPQALKTHCRQGHPYDEDNTYVRATGGRHCRACGRERARPRNEKRSAARRAAREAKAA